MFLLMYSLMTLAFLGIGINSLVNDTEPEFRRIGAIVTLGSVVWPLLVAMFFGIVLIHIFKIALGKE